MKKIKTKKAAVKKTKPSTTAAASTEDTSIDSEEKENVGSSRRPSESNDPSGIKMDDVKTSSTRKRPLEDIDVEGQSFFSKYLSKCLICLTLVGLSVAVTAILLVVFCL